MTFFTRVFERLSVRIRTRKDVHPNTVPVLWRGVRIGFALGLLKLIAIPLAALWLLHWLFALLGLDLFYILTT